MRLDEFLKEVERVSQLSTDTGCAVNLVEVHSINGVIEFTPLTGSQEKFYIDTRTTQYSATAREYVGFFNFISYLKNNPERAETLLSEMEELVDYVKVERLDNYNQVYKLLRCFSGVGSGK